jgi:hypothetical protein
MLKFTNEELRAMAWGYGFSIPLGGAAIYFGGSPLAAVPIFLVGFIITLFRLTD